MVNALSQVLNNVPYIKTSHCTVSHKYVQLYVAVEAKIEKKKSKHSGIFEYVRWSEHK